MRASRFVGSLGLLGACASPPAESPAGRAPLALVFTSRGEGELEPCG